MFHYQEVKKAFVEMYGETLHNWTKQQFDVAFESAWDEFDYVPTAESPYDVAIAMSELPQFQDDYWELW